MTDKDIEFAKHRMEVLKMARTLLNEEYINKRAEDHNKWLAEADQAWRNKGIKLPYPQFAPYPTEEQILERAKSLLKFVVEEEKECEPEPTEPVPEPFPETIPDSGQLFAPSTGSLIRPVTPEEKIALSPLTQSFLEGKTA